MKGERKKVLVTPLDWGLGHATRCIPIIRELKTRGFEVMIASSGDALILLQGEFPETRFFELPSYQVSYSKHYPLILKVISQVPKFLMVRMIEHKEINKIVKEQSIDLVISDNRYGCWTKLVPAILITHQINIQMPSFLKWMQGIVNYFNHRQIQKFHQCWIPDFPEPRLTGKLTETELPVKFIGILSRFQKKESEQLMVYDYLALISGPEPQRTMFEQKIRLRFTQLKGRKIIVRGLPGMSEEVVRLSEWDEVCHCKTEQLQLLIEQSKLIICRSGYSSIMDLAVLNKQALFIPTPGQTEQEYLGEQLMKERIALSLPQDSFSESELNTKGFTGFISNTTSHLLKKEIDNL